MAIAMVELGFWQLRRLHEKEDRRAVLRTELVADPQPLAQTPDPRRYQRVTLTGRYERDAVLRELLMGSDEIRALREKVWDLPEDASYYDRVRLGELVVAALGERRQIEGAQILKQLEPFAVATVSHQLASPEDVVDNAFLIERERQQEFDDAVEDIGEELAGRVRLRLLGPVAAYDFVGRG